MDHLSAAGKVSAAGMEVQRRRLEVLTGNLVNSNTTQAAGTEPYRRKDVFFVTAARESENFKSSMDTAMSEVQGVQIAEVVRDAREPLKQYEPNHPHADKDGYVLYPNIDPAEEMAQHPLGHTVLSGKPRGTQVNGRDEERRFGHPSIGLPKYPGFLISA
jgi:flagellar basal-body rod protein FlgC